MAPHISRKELKKDEIRDTLAHGAEAVISHQKLSGVILSAALLVAVAILGWRFYTERQTVKASAALEDGMKVFQARIRVVGEPAEPGELTYVAEKNKYEDAAKKFAEVARKYPRTHPGQFALYYVALSQEHLDRYDDAVKGLQRLESSSDTELAGLARFQLAQVYQKTGKTDDAVRLLRQLADKPTALVPKPTVLLALGDLLQASKPAEAGALYLQIKKDFPNTAIGDEADKRLELIPPKS